MDINPVQQWTGYFVEIALDLQTGARAIMIGITKEAARATVQRITSAEV